MMAQFAVVKPHSHKLPPGYHLAGTTPSAHTSMAHMSMEPLPIPLREVAAAGWHRVAVRLGNIAAAEAVMMLALLGLWRVTRSLRAVVARRRRSAT
jgi:hypothetical protein